MSRERKCDEFISPNADPDGDGICPDHCPSAFNPSQADELITHRLRDALALVDVRILDHIIVAGNDTLSMAERGLI